MSVCLIVWLTVTKLVNATPLTVLTGSFWNCAGVFVKVGRCAWRFVVILRLNFSIFGSSDLVLWAQLHLQILPDLFETCRCFCQGLKMCMPFCCNPQIFFHCLCSSDFLGLTAFRHWKSCECNSSYRFSLILLKFCRCFSQGLKTCMIFGCNP